MSSSTKIENPKIWASPLGSKAEVSDLPQTVDTATSAEASFEYIFPHLTERSEEDGGCPPRRTDFNAIFKELGDQLYFLQRGGFYQYDASVEYKRNAIIQYNGVLYQSLKGGNTGNTPGIAAGADWWKRLNAIESINGEVPDGSGNITLDLSGKADLDETNVFHGDNTFAGKTSVDQLPVYSGKNMPDAASIRDEELPTMGAVREHVAAYGGGGGGGDGSGLVQQVTIITPKDGSKKVSVLTELVGEPYESAFEKDPRAYREFQITTADDQDWRKALTFKRNSDSYALDYNNRLTETTQYKWRVRDVSERPRYSEWSRTSFFTTGEDVGVYTPGVISITGGERNEVSESPEIITSAFSVTAGSDRHECTQWVIRTQHNNKVIFDSEEDRSNLTRITLPVGTLEENTNYELTVRYKGVRYGWSGWGLHNFTTALRFTYVASPTISIENDGLQVLGAPTFNTSAFRLITTTGAVDNHRSTSWLVEDRDGQKIWESLEDREHLRTITMPNNLLEPDTGYRVKVKYHGRYYESSWSEENFITAEKFEHIAQPVLTVNGAPDNVPETPVLTGSAFTVLPQGRATDTHVSTDWVVYDDTGEREVWSSKNDARNLTSISVPKGRLTAGETYLFTVLYKGKKYGPSERAEVRGTTRTNFTYVETPTLDVEGAPNDVRETPVLTGSTFKVVSDSGESDTHQSTHWLITRLDTGAIIYENKADSTNLTSFTVPAGTLEPDTSYRFQVAYNGARHGTSGMATVEGRTHSTLAHINNPVLTVEGHPNNIGQTPKLTGSPFSVFSDNDATDTHSATDWQVLTTDSRAVVWQELKGQHLTSVTVPASQLQTSTEYLFRVRYHGIRLAPTNWVEVRGTTMSAFDYVSTPTVSITAGCVTGPTDVLETPTFTGTAFNFASSSGQVDTHESTEWKVVATATPDSVLWEKTVTTGQGDLTSISMPKGKLQLTTAYKVMVRYKGKKFGYSQWAELAFNTHTTFTYIQAPQLNVPGMPDQVKECPILDGGKFTVVPSSESDTHESTDWVITKVDSGEEIWSSKEDAENKTSIKVPKAKLTVSTRYKAKVRFKGAAQGYSAWTEVEFTTADEFSPIEAPGLTVEQDNLGIYEAPFLTTTAFINADQEGDTHVATDWKVMEASGRKSVWTSLSNTTERRYVQMPNGKLKPSTRYIFAVRFKGGSGEWSPWTEITGTTQETFYDNNAPSLANANIDKAGSKLRFEFSTPPLYTRPGKTKATHVRVKVQNKTQSDQVDQFTTEVTTTGNYVIERTNSYELSEDDEFEYSVFYKGSSSDDDEGPLSTTVTRRATVNENILVMLESVTGTTSHAYINPTFTISLNFGQQTFDHTKTDWEIKDVTNSKVVWSSMSDAVHKTTVYCDKTLDSNSYYHLHVKAYGSKTGVPAESQPLIIKFRTSQANGIGTPGEAGFGVGTAPQAWCDHLGMSPMDGTFTPGSDNYGNYLDKKGNQWVFIPAFCYTFDKAKLGDLASRSASAFKVKAFAEFGYDEARANADNYILHRAFIDEGKKKEGFFITKYLVGKGNVSKKNTIAISLTASGTDAPSKDSTLNTECAGQARDALTISRKMTDNKGNCASIFMYSALSMLSDVHGLHATSTQHCAWYDPTGVTSFPKGCNNSALGDHHDKEIKYECSDTKIAAKGNTGGANHIARCSHNGQMSGVIDLNGLLEEVAIGIQIMNSNSHINKFQLLKESVALNSLTADTVEVDNSNVYERVNCPASVSNSATAYWGHASQNIYFTDNNGTNRAYCGVYPAVKSDQSYGHNAYGQDYAYASWNTGYAGHGLMRVGGAWSYTSYAGVFCRHCSSYGSSWAYGTTSWGFRAAAYGPSDL